MPISDQQKHALYLAARKFGCPTEVTDRLDAYLAGIHCGIETAANFMELRPEIAEKMEAALAEKDEQEETG